MVQPIRPTSAEFDEQPISGVVNLKATDKAKEFVSQYGPKLEGDAGIDLYLVDDVTLYPHSPLDLPSGIRLWMPNDWWAEVRARSSTSRRLIHVFPGVIDPGYTGELFACVFNLSQTPIQLKRGDRLAQVIFHKRVQPTIVDIGDAELPKTERGERGFGSTDGGRQ